jgi:hypothetical protein
MTIIRILNIKNNSLFYGNDYDPSEFNNHFHGKLITKLGDMSNNILRLSIESQRDFF